MAPSVSLDFGRTATKVAIWDAALGEPVSLAINDISRECMAGAYRCWPIPSVIRWCPESGHGIGHEAEAEGSHGQPDTFRFLGHTVVGPRPGHRIIEGHRVTPVRACEMFLRIVLDRVIAVLGTSDAPLALTVPAAASDAYGEWLELVARRAGFPNTTVIPDAAAAAVGCGVTLRVGEPVMMIDFGGCSLNVTVLKVEDRPDWRGFPRWRRVAAAVQEIGGEHVDRWARAEGLDRRDTSNKTRPVPTVAPGEETTGRHSIIKMLEDRGLFDIIDHTITLALQSAERMGVLERHVRHVVAVGGACLVRGVGSHLTKRFGTDRLVLDRPLDAIARGAAALAAGVSPFDRILHGYSIRQLDTSTGNYTFNRVVDPGTGYPSEGTVASFLLRATRDQQRDFPIAVYQDSQGQSADPRMDPRLVFRPDGPPQIVFDGRQHDGGGAPFMISGEHAVVLRASPPAHLAERRFSVDLSINGARHLLVTARDLRTGEVVLKNKSAARLT